MVVEKSPDDVELTYADIPSVIEQISRKWAAMREAVQDESFPRTRALIGRHEPELDVQAMSQLLQGIVPTLERLAAAGEPAHKATLDGLKARIATLKHRIDEQRNFTRDDLSAALEQDKNVALGEAKALEDIGTAEDIGRKYEGLRTDGLVTIRTALVLLSGFAEAMNKDVAVLERPLVGAGQPSQPTPPARG